MRDVKVGVIGGSGLYEIEGVDVLEDIYPETPWGYPSDKITIARVEGRKIAFLPRHGRGHFLNPSEVPSRANIAALKSVGAEEILAFSAVGSLQEEIPPRDFILPSQIIDRTKGIRPSTFFEHGIVLHASFGDPFCPHIEEIVYRKAVELGIKMHRQKTLVCMEGPAFSTRAESRMYRSFGADIINMSVLPEAKLAREAEISYQMVCMSTDYDSWRHEDEAVTTDYIIQNIIANASNAKLLLKATLPFLGKISNPLQGSVHKALITDKRKRSPEMSEKLRYLFPEYF